MVSAPLCPGPCVIILWFQPHSVSGPMLLYFGFSPTLSRALCYYSLVSAPLCLRPYVIILWFQPHSVCGPMLLFFLSYSSCHIKTIIYKSPVYNYKFNNSQCLEKYTNRVKIKKNKKFKLFFGSTCSVLHLDCEVIFIIACTGNLLKWKPYLKR